MGVDTAAATLPETVQVAGNGTERGAALNTLPVLPQKVLCGVS